MNPNRKRQSTWDRLAEEQRNNRARPDALRGGKSNKLSAGAAPHEITVQRLSSEPDNKQTYRPVIPREFVSFPYEDLTLLNLRKACSTHFNLPTSSCDILVTNKGPSCSNIKQIPHRKDKVYLVRFVVSPDDNADSGSQYGLGQDFEEFQDFERNSRQGHKPMPLNKTGGKGKRSHPSSGISMETEFPESVSIATLLNAGKLIKPKAKRDVELRCERFDVAIASWKEEMVVKCSLETEKFSSGGFCNAYHASISSMTTGEKHWVVKTYNDKALKSITETLKTTPQNHCRKQVQMHEVARHLTKKFREKAPKEFGECFNYNHIYFTTIDEEPATIEEFVPGNFAKLINNNGKCASFHDESESFQELLDKAECLVHYTYKVTNEQMMLLDIQGSGFNLYDPEIATKEVMDEKNKEFFFCCGNCSTIGIDNFLKEHACTKYCEMMELDSF